jgi:tRNA(fMet)-specific endonuclease VapC
MKPLDTSVVVDTDRGGIEQKVQKLDDQGRHLLSMVSVTELRLGVELQYEQGTDAYETAMAELDRLLARFDIHPISRPVATNAAELIAILRAKGHRLDDLHDIYIGATARTRQLPVVTANVDDFEPMSGVQVINWESF